MDWVDTSWVTQIYLLLLFYIIKRIISTSFFPFQMFSFRYEERYSDLMVFVSVRTFVSMSSVSLWSDCYSTEAYD
jgi:hypothetical protein